MGQTIRFPLDLQFFAVGDDGVDPGDVKDDAAPQDDKQDDADLDLDSDVEIEFDADDSDEDNQDTDDDSDSDDADDSADDADAADKAADKSKGNNQTATAVIAERKKWQAKLAEANKANGLAQKLMKMTGAKDLEDLQRRLDAAEAAELVKTQKLTPEEAQRRVDENRRIEKLEQDLRKQKYDSEFQTLAKDPVFAGIENSRDELQELAEKTGLTIKQAYFSLFGEQRLKDREAEVEARVKANKDKRQSKKVDTGSTTSGQKPGGKSYNLTPEQLAAAEYGVKKGHFKSIEEYARYLRS